MKTKLFGSKREGFTLIELLVVIAIIGILAGLLLPVFAKVKQIARIAVAKSDIQNLATSITHYDADYGRMPTSREAAASGSPDITYGTFPFGTMTPMSGPKGVQLPAIPANPALYKTDNSEVTAILMDQTNSTGPLNPSLAGHSRNPQRTSYTSPKGSADNTSHGLGSDLVYRDPWGSPYIISMDLNGDNNCVDALYSYDLVSSGANGFVSAGGANTMQLVGKTVMIWSLGPDANATNTISGKGGVNKDNILSW